jgi:hypothetical protein
MTEDLLTREISWIEAVLRRPRMYTISGTVLEVYAFIDGYISGLARSNYADPRVDEWNEFCTWLSQATETSRPHAILRILAEAGGDEAAFVRLIDHYRNFQMSRDQKPDTRWLGPNPAS